MTSMTIDEQLLDQARVQQFNPPKYKDKGMLILTRRIGESLIIGNDIVLTVLGVKGHQVRIGVGLFNIGNLI